MLRYKADNYRLASFVSDVIDILIFFLHGLDKKNVFFCGINVTVAFLKRDRSGVRLSSVFEFPS